MVNAFDLEELNNLIEQLNNDCREYWYDGTIINEEIDYGDLKKEIFNIQREIKNIVERWEE